MSEELLNTGATTAPDRQSRLASLWSRIARRIDSRALAMAACLITFAVMLAYSPFKQLERGDAAIYDYIAQSILRGDLPYRDIIDPKAPASMFLSAAAMASGRLFRLPDLLAVRLLHLLLMACLALLTFLVAEIYLRHRAAAFLAALLPVLREETVVMMLQGTQPKLPLLLFGLLTLLMIAKDRPVWAGICAMLSCLCWQPGLLFAGAALLVFSRYLTSWRDGRVVKLVVGAALPLVVMVVYFYVRGGLGALVEWTLVFPYSVFAPHSQRTLAEAAGHIGKVFFRVYQRDVVLVALSAMGYVMFAVARLRAKFKAGGWLQSPELFRDAILYPPLVYLLFCLINMQGGPDLIPFIPFMGMFAGWFIVEAGRKMGRLLRRKRGGEGARVIEEWLPRVAAAAILLLVVGRAVTNRFTGRSLQRQEETIQTAFAELGPDDKLYVHGPAEILLFLNRRNLNPYISFDSGADDYIGGKRAGGFAEVLAEIEAQAPKFVVMSRLRNVTHRDELRQWLGEHYDKLPVKGYEIYLRKP